MTSTFPTRPIHALPPGGMACYPKTFNPAPLLMMVPNRRQIPSLHIPVHNCPYSSGRRRGDPTVEVRPRCILRPSVQGTSPLSPSLLSPSSLFTTLFNFTTFTLSATPFPLHLQRVMRPTLEKVGKCVSVRANVHLALPHSVWDWLTL